MKKFLLIWRIISTIVTVYMIFGVILITLGNGWKKLWQSVCWWADEDSYMTYEVSDE